MTSDVFGTPTAFYKPLVNLNAIGFRPDPVVRDGVWLEVQSNIEVNEAVRSALLEERRIAVRIQYKEAKLKKFRRDVYRRVREAAALQENYIARAQTIKMQKERKMLCKSASAAEIETPKKNKCSYNVNPITIDCNGKITAAADLEDKLSHSLHADPKLDIRTKQFANASQLARLKLARRSLVPNKPLNESLGKDNKMLLLPGGAWGVGASRDKSAARLFNTGIVKTPQNDKKGKGDESITLETISALHAPSDVALVSVQETINSDKLLKSKSDIGSVHFKLKNVEFHSEETLPKKSSGKMAKIPGCSATSSNAYKADIENFFKPPIISAETVKHTVLHSGKVALEQKRSDERTRWLSRRVFADAERERTRERQRLKLHKHRVARLREEKEQNRLEIEKKSRQQIEAVSRAKKKIQRQMKEQEDKSTRIKENIQKQNLKMERFTSALRKVLREKATQNKIELPPLCICANNFWGTDPTTCANNCLFYGNHQAYAKALEAVLQALENDSQPFHKNALQRSALSLPLIAKEEPDIAVPAKTNKLSSTKKSPHQ